MERAIPKVCGSKKFRRAAQIMAVADVYDALRTARKYKPAIDHDQSVKIVIEGQCLLTSTLVSFGPSENALVSSKAFVRSLVAEIWPPAISAAQEAPPLSA